MAGLLSLLAVLPCFVVFVAFSKRDTLNYVEYYLRIELYNHLSGFRVTVPKDYHGQLTDRV